jgi:hypothetical protein
VLWVGSSANSAVLAPLVGGGACPTFPVGSRGEGGHDGRVVHAGYVPVTHSPFLLGSHAYVGQKLANNGTLGMAGKVLSRQTILLHLIKVNLKDLTR